MTKARELGDNAQNTKPKVIDAKGDLIVGTGSDAADNLAAGNSGETLVADSSTTTGLAYREDYAAGKNKIINGDFNINQRGFSSSTVNAEYNFDRWRTIYTGGTSTTSVQVFTPGTAPVAGYEGKNYYRIVISGQSATGDSVRMQQQVESVRTFAGQTTTYSFWAKADSGTPSVAIISVQGFGSGGSPSAGVTTEHGTITLSTSWTRYTVTCIIPSISGKTLGTTDDGSVSIRLLMSAGTGVTGHQGIGVQNYTFETWGHQWEAGLVATAFQTSTGTLAGELAACQRYYYVHAVGASQAIGVGAQEQTGLLITNVKFPVNMRTAPTLSASSGTDYYQFTRNSATDLFNSFTIIDSNITNAHIYNNSEISGTVGFCGRVSTYLTAAASVAFSSEL